jgi:HEAT repeat protein
MKNCTPRQKNSDRSRRNPGRLAFAVAIVVFIPVEVCSTGICRAQSAATENEIVEPQLLALRDPELLMSCPTRKLPDSFLTLWIEALAGPEYELKRDAAMSITHAHREGYRDCSAATDALMESLNHEATPRSVLVEVARALSTIEAKKSSTRLKALLKKGRGTHFELVAETALARWGDADMPAIWQERLTSDDVPRHRRLLALQAITLLPEAMKSDTKLHSILETLVASSHDPAMLLEAARTLGNVKCEGLEPFADRLVKFSSDEASYTAMLASVYLLLSHESASSQELLLRILTNSLTNPRRAPIVRAAWTRLLQRDVSELASLAPQAIQHSDAEVRRNAIETLTDFPTDDGVALLGIALDDRHPDIRRVARQALLILSRNESLIWSVRQAGLAAIARSSWREQEQAIVLLAMLDHLDAADRMLQLVSSPRAEVAVAAAWGLRKLNVKETLATLLTIAERLDKQIENGMSLQPHEPVVLAHIFEAIGLAKYERSILLVKRWIPKDEPRVNFEEARTSAVWATGWLFEGGNNVALAQQLKARLTDVGSLMPESPTVRYAAGIAIGRIGATEVASDVRRIALTKSGEPELAAAWSLERLTGEVVSPPEPAVVAGAHWNLLPIGSRRKSATTEQKSR